MAHRAVYKTTTAEYLDQFYSGASRPLDEAFDDATALMEREGSLADAAREVEERRDHALDAGNTDAFENAWLAGKHGAQPVDRVLRLGYLRAVEVARARGVPIENFWVTGAGDELEMHICEGADRVHVFLFVPGEDERPYGSTRSGSRSWVVRAGDVDVRDDAPRTALDDGDPPITMTQVSGDLGAKLA